ncbi:MAG: hypothetical protein DI538_12975 [Azospira oryzae]|jgi:hypothetical protein|nr:MAG: hypothetical protein DI538_12975 [Azospira oryzae]
MIQQSTLFPGLHATKNESNLAVFDAFLAQLKSPLHQSSVDVVANVHVTYVYRNQVVHDRVTVSLANAGYDRGNIRIRNGVTLNSEDFQMALTAHESKYQMNGTTLVVESRSSRMGEFRVEFNEIVPSSN